MKEIIMNKEELRLCILVGCYAKLLLYKKKYKKIILEKYKDDDFRYNTNTCIDILNLKYEVRDIDKELFYEEAELFINDLGNEIKCCEELNITPPKQLRYNIDCMREDILASGIIDLLLVLVEGSLLSLDAEIGISDINNKDIIKRMIKYMKYTSQSDRLLIVDNVALDMEKYPYTYAVLDWMIMNR